MGDRAHVKVQQSQGVVYLYTHWGGSEMRDSITTGLTRAFEGDRWNDDEYLTRILFDAIKGDDVTSTTGFGISASTPDGVEWIVNIPEQIVQDPQRNVRPFADYVRVR